LIPPNHSPANIPAFFAPMNHFLKQNSCKKEIGLLTEVLTQRNLSSAFVSMKRLVPEYNPENGQ